jgi:alpha,alpha-trehalose phosphorylase
LRFGLCYRGRRLKIDVSPEQARYELAQGDPIELTHHGKSFKLLKGSPKTRPIPAISPGEPPPPPHGRAPRRRHGEA